jgi:peptidoglycan L-alanyl-D-glutamate endopeptidase CwlK
MNKASKRTLGNLYGVHHKLVAVVAYALAISEIDFFVNEGLRTLEKQQEYYNKGLSQLDGIKKRGNHQDNPNTPDIDARAVDVYYVGWKNTDSQKDKRWLKLKEAFEIAAHQLGVKLVFGYDWGWDNPHIELDKTEV